MDKGENLTVVAKEFETKFVVLSKRLLNFCQKTCSVTDAIEARIRMDAAQKMWEQWSKHIAGGSTIISKKMECYSDMETQVQDSYFKAMAVAQRCINGTRTDDEMGKHKNLTEADKEFEAKSIVLSKRLFYVSSKLEQYYDKSHRFATKLRMDIAQKIWEEWRNHIAGGSLIISKKHQFYADLENNVQDAYVRAMSHALHIIEAK